MFYITFAALVVLSVAALYSGLTVTEYIVYSDKISSSIKLVLLTDLHSCAYGEAQRVLIDRIRKQNPDVVLMAGDIFDGTLPESRVTELLEGIAGEYPCYYVTGNHELWSGRAGEQKDILRSYGVTVLEGTGEQVMINGQSIIICGVDDPTVGQAAFDAQLENAAGCIDAQLYSVLLSHRPELLPRYAAYDFDLVLSGHAHGGQWRIPLFLPNGLYAPNQGRFPKYTNGIYEKGGTKLLVSRGLARETTRVPRIFNAPQLVVVSLTSGPAK